MIFESTGFFILSIFILLVLYTLYGRTDKKLDKVIELNGDSVLFGHGLPQRVSTSIKYLFPEWEIIDKTAVGLTMKKLVEGYKEPYYQAPKEYFPNGPQKPFMNIERKASIVVLELGANDAYEKRSVNDFTAHLLFVLDILEREKKTVILTGIVQVVVSPPFDQEVVDLCGQYNKVIRQIAKDKKIIHAGWDEEDFNKDTDSTDGIHRNEEETDRLISRLIFAIDKV